MAITAGRPTLFLIAGPNGAGKTTFYETVLAARLAAPFINADIIQRDEMIDPSVEAAYQAAAIAEARRREFMAEGRSFVMETVFSHPSKLGLLRDARDAGYRMIVFHLGLASANLAVARVKERVKQGGHKVPEQKIRDRFARNQQLIRQAVLMADRALVFDSSALNTRPTVLLETANGQVVDCSEERPDWLEALYGDLV